MAGANSLSMPSSGVTGPILAAIAVRVEPGAITDTIMPCTLNSTLREAAKLSIP
jgi:hypothetical protein